MGDLHLIRPHNVIPSGRRNSHRCLRPMYRSRNLDGLHLWAGRQWPAVPRTAQGQQHHTWATCWIAGQSLAGSKQQALLDPTARILPEINTLGALGAGAAGTVPKSHLGSAAPTAQPQPQAAPRGSFGKAMGMLLGTV